MQNPVPVCVNCKHFNERRFSCSAFPDGIPFVIKSGESDHREPLEDQENEIIFEPLTK